jgi:hypothetical protein
MISEIKMLYAWPIYRFMIAFSVSFSRLGPHENLGACILVRLRNSVYGLWIRLSSFHLAQGTRMM